MSLHEDEDGGNLPCGDGDGAVTPNGEFPVDISNHGSHGSWAGPEFFLFEYIFFLKNKYKLLSLF